MPLLWDVRYIWFQLNIHKSHEVGKLKIYSRLLCPRKFIISEDVLYYEELFCEDTGIILDAYRYINWVTSYYSNQVTG